jgi:hypothetical protein
MYSTAGATLNYLTDTALNMEQSSSKNVACTSATNAISCNYQTEDNAAYTDLYFSSLASDTNIETLNPKLRLPKWKSINADAYQYEVCVYLEPTSGSVGDGFTHKVSCRYLPVLVTTDAHDNSDDYCGEYGCLEVTNLGL